jgi:phosphotriesterase-related protein
MVGAGDILHPALKITLCTTLNRKGAHTMSEIMTVNGPIAPENLGFTSMHEHILYNGRVFRQRFEDVLSGSGIAAENCSLSMENLGRIKHGFIMCPDAIVMEDEEIMAAELSDFKAEGGSAVVDMSTPGMRVDPLKTLRVSERSGIHIVTTTGFYSEDSWPEEFRDMTLSDMENHMMDEIENGIGDSGVRPGHVKVAIEGDFPENEVNAVRAGARVAKRTGFSMTVHQGMLLGPDAGEKIAGIIEPEKLDPQRVVIAHSDGNFVEHDMNKLILDPDSRGLDLSHATWLLERGYNISVDCFGHFWDGEIMGMCAMPDWQRLAGMVELMGKGYTGQIVVGTDTFVKILLKHYGGEGYCRLTRFVVPSLRSASVPESDIQQVTMDNPASILAY